MPEFKAGDVVRLKSGGPRMTLYFISGANVTCKYFNKVTGLIVQETFFMHMLEVALPGEGE
jgi:uncharacterized protein YodC (DUF2158 family)